LAIADGMNTKVSVLLGNGDGSFLPAVQYDTSLAAEYVVSADFNGDGELDLLVSGQGTISILHGNGDGTFRPAISSPTGGSPFVAVADFNGDGRMDVATGTGMARGESDIGTLLIFLGNGDGTFKAPISSSFFWPQSFVAADFNGDGKIDLAAAVRENIFGGDIRVVLGNGDGTFAASTQVKGTFASSVAAIDLNNDGRPDLIGLEYFDPQSLPMEIQWMLGNGDGTFQDSQFNPCSQASSCLQLFAKPSSFATADVSGGKLLVTTNPDDDSVSVFLAENGGPDFSISATPLTPGSVVAGDSASATVIISRVGAFSSSVAFTCSVQPLPVGAPTCAVSPGTSSTTANVRVETTAQTSARTARSLKFLYALTLPLAALVLITMGHREKRGRGPACICLVGAALLIGVLSQSACGRGSNTGSGTHATPPGFYTVTVTGTAGSLHHSVTLRLAVN